MSVVSFRKSLKLTQAQLAEAVGMRAKTYISRLERAEAKGERAASLSLALRLELFSRQRLRAVDLSDEAAELGATIDFAQASAQLNATVQSTAGP